MADGSDKTSKGIQKRLKREAHPQKASPQPPPKEGGDRACGLMMDNVIMN